jgi:hypothetical protein
MDANEPVVVYTTTNPVEAEIIKVALANEGIQAMVTGEAQGGFSGMFPEVTVVVPAPDATRAREILEHRGPATDVGDPDDEGPG